MEPELESWIEDVIEQGWDLGTVYGHLRLWWRSSEHSTAAIERMEARKGAWEALYEYSLEDHVNIKDPQKFPPRRIWDLYSNRVLPFHVLLELDPFVPPIHPYVWAVSHCWVPDSERHNIFTSINGREWPVPIPKDTTLDHVRIELLNMGAEYVFLDVLCLRQEYGLEWERLREE